MTPSSKNAMSETVMRNGLENNMVKENESSSNRRAFLRNCVSVAVAASSMGGQLQPAQATYSAYTAREQDWEARQKSGEVKMSSARDLKAQLREIAPMNEKVGLEMVFLCNG